VSSEGITLDDFLMIPLEPVGLLLVEGFTRYCGVLLEVRKADLCYGGDRCCCNIDLGYFAISFGLPNGVGSVYMKREGGSSSPMTTDSPSVSSSNLIGFFFIVSSMESVYLCYKETIFELCIDYTKF
jgi:hypothetical protein